MNIARISLVKSAIAYRNSAAKAFLDSVAKEYPVKNAKAFLAKNVTKNPFKTANKFQSKSAVTNKSATTFLERFVNKLQSGKLSTMPAKRNFLIDAESALTWTSDTGQQ